jgi:cytochrome P450
MTANDALLFDPFNPTWRANPYLSLNKLRETDPVYKSPLGMYLISEYEDVKEILKHKAASSDLNKAAELSGIVPTRQQPDIDFSTIGDFTPFLFRDPPDHTRLRKLVSKAFTPKMVEGLAPRIYEITDSVMAKAVQSGGMELISELAYVVPVTIISELLGVPPEDHEIFKSWSDVIARGLDPDFLLPPDILERRTNALFAFVAYFGQLIEKLRKQPADNLLSDLIRVQEGGDVLKTEELLSICILLLIAGHETTVNLIGNAVRCICEFEVQDAIKNNRELIKLTIEEVLRFDPPVQLTGRFFLEEINLKSAVLPKHSFALLLLAAANRDPKAFKDPEIFDIKRDPNPHLSFGFGIHHCLGAPLARLEAQIVFDRLFGGPKVTLASQELCYKDNMVLRGLESLEIVFS